MSDRTGKLQDWLREHNAVQMWRVRDDVDPDVQITAYVINGQEVLVVESDHGWNIYVPASDSSKVDDTLADAEKRLKIEGSASLRVTLHALNEAARPK